MSSKLGVSDLMLSKRLRVSDVQSVLKKTGTPGNWESYQNVHNLLHGRMPRDASAFIVLAKIFEVELEVIVSRYSAVLDKIEIDFELNEKEERTINELLILNDRIMSLEKRLADQNEIFTSILNNLLKINFNKPN
jgi:hypothetical protein